MILKRNNKIKIYKFRVLVLLSGAAFFMNRSPKEIIKVSACRIFLRDLENLRRVSEIRHISLTVQGAA